MLHSCVFQTAETDTESPEFTKCLTAITRTQSLNKHVLADVSPDLARYVSVDNSSNFAIFINNINQINIVDTTTGAALYGMTPPAECELEFSDFLADAPYFSLNSSSGIEQNLQQADVLLLFGLGLGRPLQHIIEQLDVKFVIVYEPRPDIFTCSTFALDWQSLLDIAKQRGIYLGLQIGNAGSNLAEHLAEILTIQPDITRIYYYRHLAHPVSDEIIQYYNQHSGDMTKLLRAGRQFMGFDKTADYIPIRAGAMLGNITPEPYTAGQELFAGNMAALAKYFPGLADFYRDYQVERWQLVRDAKGAPNLYQLSRRCMLYRNFQDDTNQLNRRFFTQTVKSNTQVKQLVPYKLRHYNHYKALGKLQLIEQQFAHSADTRLEQISSIVLAGCSLSLPLDELLSKTNLKNIFVFEPEPDFFYASLFLLPWHTFLEQLDKAGRQLYLNVGGSTAVYFDEILHQFYRVGAYALAETCFWLNYVTPGLNATLTTLQQQLRTVLALGDYFDHARYGLTHTLDNLAADSLFMKNSRLAAPWSELPVFIVGNGPSLDQTVDYIRQYQGRALVISCGTAIRPLISYGIVPDFHVEAEQNATTYDHLNNTADPAILKAISLISFSSVHPATRALFKQALLAFKEGEAPTVVLKQEAEQQLKQALMTISYAFPTAANLALSFALSLGHQQIYLFGVDFGQADPAYHHSKKSIYYTKSGNESYDYRKKNPEEIMVPGNFRDHVYTKSEFDLARKICEMLLRDFQRQTEVYNCSDGALIRGATPLLPENILLSAAAINKAAYHHVLLSQYFTRTNQLTALFNRYMTELLTVAERESVLDWRDMLQPDVHSVQAAKDFLAQQWLYFENEVTNSRVVFCLYYSSAGYFFSRFTALLNIAEHELPLQEKLQKFDAMLAIFRQFLTESVESIKAGEHEHCSAVLAFLRRSVF